MKKIRKIRAASAFAFTALATTVMPVCAYDEGEHYISEGTEYYYESMEKGEYPEYYTVGNYWMNEKYSNGNQERWLWNVYGVNEGKNLSLDGILPYLEFNEWDGDFRELPLYFEGREFDKPGDGILPVGQEISWQHDQEYNYYRIRMDSNYFNGQTVSIGDSFEASKVSKHQKYMSRKHTGGLTSMITRPLRMTVPYTFSMKNWNRWIPSTKQENISWSQLYGHRRN